MAKRKINSRALRQLAAKFLDDVAEEVDLLVAEREDLTTSLVRQWVSYEGNATLFFGERQVYALLARTPLGRGNVIADPVQSGWTRILREEWRINDDDLHDIFYQLNRGQSAEVVNQDGTPLRLWVDPKARSRNVEPLAAEPMPSQPVKHDYVKLALHELKRLFGEEVDDQELDELAHSVAKQWQHYNGHACVFLHEGEQALFRLIERPNGGGEIKTYLKPIHLDSVLTSLGCPPENIAEVIARLNLGQEIEVRDASGEPSILWHDPKARRVRVRHINPKPVSRPHLASIFCPKCTAVLKPWVPHQHEQVCPNCKCVVSLRPNAPPPRPV